MWKIKIRDLYTNFNLLEVNHLFREFNKEAKSLSKQALSLKEGSFVVIDIWREAIVAKILYLF